MLNPRHISAMAKVAMAAAIVALTALASEKEKPFVVYHDRSPILFTPQLTDSGREATVGHWDLGENLEDRKLRDKRLNLYVVFPGGQYRSFLHSRYNHTLVINKYTIDGRPREWDVFWCLVLDPSLHGDLRSEQELLVAANQKFLPANNFEIHRVPAHAVMAEKLNVNNVDDLRRFRGKDGALPRVLIVPAHMAVRATTAKTQHKRD